MNILPRFLYLFQSLPIEIPENQFRKWDKVISRFIWNGHRPRIKFETLQLEKHTGGMGLTNLKEYFYAAQIRPVACWRDKAYRAKWKDLEQFTQGQEIQSFIGDGGETKELLQKVDSLTQFTLKMWLHIVRKYILESELRLLQWVAYDKRCIPNSFDLNNGFKGE